MAPARAETLCTLVVDASDGRAIMHEGDCRTRVTPASTAKLALAVMGFDAGILKDAHTPRRPFRIGYADWLGDIWRQPTDPARWLKHSVVWYSQLLARDLGQARLEQYASAFGYGNADFSGDPGKANGLERAWISSSLQISPEEQVAFLRKLVTRTLPVSLDVYDKMLATIEVAPLQGGLRVYGKTGTAFPRRPDGKFDRSRAYGWYVGWAQKGGRMVVFARLDRGDMGIAAGRSVRDALLRKLPVLAAPVLP